jgi:hypothetical protein
LIFQPSAWRGAFKRKLDSHRDHGSGQRGCSNRLAGGPLQKPGPIIRKPLDQR